MLATAPDTELDYDPNERRPLLRLVKRSGVPADERWEWVEDPTATETGSERHARLLADTRLVDLHGVAAITQRRYSTIKDMRHEGDAQRTIAATARRTLNPDLADEYGRLVDDMRAYPVASPEWADAERQLAYIDAQVAKHARKLLSTADAPDIQQALFRFEEATDKLLTCIPRQRDEQGQSPLWSVGEIVRWRRQRRMNDIWGRKLETRGRPPGSRSR